MYFEKPRPIRSQLLIHDILFMLRQPAVLSFLREAQRDLSTAKQGGTIQSIDGRGSALAYLHTYRSGASVVLFVDAVASERMEAANKPPVADEPEPPTPGETTIATRVDERSFDTGKIYLASIVD
ncbi:hypothetical protein [Bradyrhizobium sp. CCBAU 051011]|uniref:hypothetical protein n=1 Tax=Bradyrhizobium sp. CCBAU 051011 TaxID=858422 RepID=UPI001379FFAE|nr:hypothetical protein [Bradyrhizobium sp. CCBAU 051011]